MQANNEDTGDADAALLVRLLKSKSPFEKGKIAAAQTKANKSRAWKSGSYNPRIKRWKMK